MKTALLILILSVVAALAAGAYLITKDISSGNQYGQGNYNYTTQSYQSTAYTTAQTTAQQSTTVQQGTSSAGATTSAAQVSSQPTTSSRPTTTAGSSWG